MHDKRRPFIPALLMLVLLVPTFHFVADAQTATPMGGCGWSYSIDFALTDGEPYVDPINGKTGSYSRPHWTYGNDSGSGIYNRQSGLLLTFPTAATLTWVTVYYDLSKGNYQNGTAPGMAWDPFHGSPVSTSHASTTAGTNVSRTYSGFSIPNETGFMMQIWSGFGNNSSYWSGAVYINKFEFGGTGANPFTGASGCPTATPAAPELECSASPLEGLSPLDVALDFTGSGGGSIKVDWGDGVVNSSSSHTYPTAGHYVIEVTLTDESTELADTEICGEIDVDPDYGLNNGGDQLYQPLRPIDADSARNGIIVGGYRDNANPHPEESMYWGYWTIGEQFDDYTVTAVSVIAGADVFSITDGHVVDIRDLQQRECGFRAVDVLTTFYDITDINGSACFVRMDDNVGIGEYDIGEPSNLLAFYPSNVQIVTVETMSGATLAYIVEDARSHVSIGDTITEGCILGRTIAVHDARHDDALTRVLTQMLRHVLGLNDGPAGEWEKLVQDGTNPDASDGRGVAFVQATNGVHELPLLSHLQREIYSGHRCRDVAGGQGCINTDPGFTNLPTSWEIGTGVMQIGDADALSGIVLEPGGQGWVRSNRMMTLEEGTTATLTVFVRATSANTTNARLRINFGDTMEDFPINRSDFSSNEQVLTVEYEVADANANIPIYISNIGNVGLRVSKACVMDGVYTGPDSSGSCYGNDPYFDYGGAGWDLEGSAYGVNGMIMMPFGSAIRMDDVKLYAADTGTGHVGRYYLEVNAQLWFEGDDLYPVANGDPPSFQFTWAWPDGATPAAFTYAYINTAIGGTAPLPTEGYNPIHSFPNQTFNFGAIIQVSETSIATLRITPILDGVDNALGIKLTSACLTGDFADFIIPPPDNPGGGIGTGPLPEDCSAVSHPTDATLPSWIGWLWAKNHRFYSCTLMTFLNEQYASLQSSIDKFLWMGKWAMTTAKSATFWFRDAIVPWINGHFNNVVQSMNGQIVIGDSPASLWDVLVTFFEMLGGFVSSLANTIAQILGIVPSILNFFTNVINLAMTLLSTLVTTLLTVINTIINLLVSLTTLGRALLASLTMTWNSTTAVDLPMLPSCDVNPQENILCAVIYLADNTLFSPISGFGRFFVPILIGYASIKLVLFLVNELRQLVDEIGRKV